MPILAANPRREIERRPYPLLLYVTVPVIAIGLQSFVTLHFARLPVVTVIAKPHSPIAATLAGTLIGLAQDALTHRPIGVNGIAKAVVGYLAASLGVRIDTENYLTRLLLCFVFALLHSVIFLVITSRLLALEVDWSWLHELIRGLVNAVVGVGLFALLDLAKQRDR